MTKAELIAELEFFPDDAEVHFCYPAGDYWHTTLAPKVTEVDEGYVKHSGYHQDFELIEDFDADDDQEMVILINPRFS